MKFGDKLILLRKKNGLSQEELAEKLGVSRQSVSKWESNSTYPETDKIVQICNLFDCSMDDLINEKVTDVEQTMRKNKNNLNDALDSLLDFITKTINMFSSMKFSSGFKCLLEMAILAFILFISGAAICNFASYILANLFQFLNPKTIYTIQKILTSIFYILWFILSIIVMIHTFKIRYLNYYDKIIEEKEEKKEEKQEKEEDAKPIQIQEKNPKIVIRDENDKPFAFLGILSKIIIWCIKAFVVFILLGLVCIIMALLVGDVLSISLIPINTLFVGTTISLICITIFSIQILLLGIYFIINKKGNSKIHLIIFLTSLILCGLGIGWSFISLKNFEVIDTTKDITNLEKQTKKVEYTDDLVIELEGYGRDGEYIYNIDNSIEKDTIFVSKKLDSRFYKINASHLSKEDEMKVLYVWEDFSGNYKEIYNIIIKDLKKNQIHTFYDFDNEEIMEVTANEETINKLRENLKKLYLLEEKQEENTIHIKIRDYRVYFPSGMNEGYYDARNDTLNIREEEGYECIRSIKETKWGDQIIFACNYKEDYE